MERRRIISADWLKNGVKICVFTSILGKYDGIRQGAQPRSEFLEVP